MPVPRVSVMKVVRNPMRPRAGTRYSMRIQSEPGVVSIVCIWPLRAAMSCVTAPWCSAGMSITMIS